MQPLAIRFSAIVLLWMIAPFEAFAADGRTPVTGEQLLSWCGSDRGKASLYIAAFLDTSEQVKQRTITASKHVPRNAPDYEVFLHRFVGPFCLPKSATVPQVTDIACTWLQAHPDTISHSAPRLLPHALSASYPCLEE